MSDGSPRRCRKVKLAAVIGGALVVGAMVAVFLFGRAADEGVADGDVPAVRGAQTPAATGGGLRGVSPEEAAAAEEKRVQAARQKLAEDALVTISDFFATSDLEGKARAVSDSERVLPLMREYYAERSPEPFEEADFLPVRTGARHVDSGVALFTLIPRRAEGRPTGDPFEDAEALLFLVTGADGQPRLDWETYVQTKDKAVSDFIERPRDEVATFRLSLAEVSAVEELAPGELLLDAADPARLSRPFAVSVPAGPLAETVKEGLDSVPRDRFATVTLRWSEATEGGHRLEVQDLLGWGFLGTGWDDGTAAAPRQEELAGR